MTFASFGRTSVFGNFRLSPAGVVKHAMSPLAQRAAW
jgi:hypothetical protein